MSAAAALRRTVLKLKPTKPKFIDQLNTKLLNVKLRSFKPKVEFSVDVHGYTIKTATTVEELKEVLKLRYDVFTKEFDVKMKYHEIDFDKFDLLGDHVLVINKENNQILATYRVMSTLFTDEFYSEGEFMIENFLNHPGIKMELGRACVHESFRTGAMINLVWRGIAKYAQLTNSDYMFGCTSVETINPQVAMAIFRHLEKSHYSPAFFVQPTKKYRFPNYPDLIDTEVLSKVNDYIPSLFKSYLKAGAIIHALPALDREFNCIDFFTSIELKRLNPQYMKRYFE